MLRSLFYFLGWILLVVPSCCQPVGYLTSKQIIQMTQHPTLANMQTLKKLMTRTPYNYRSRRKKSVYFAKSSAGEDHQAWISDSEQSFQQATVFACTGVTPYSDNAINILRAWPQENKAFTGPNALLEAAWGTASMSRAALLLSRINAPGWIQEDVQRYVNWVHQRLNMLWTDKRAVSWDAENRSFTNWQVSILEARLGIALLTSNGTEVTWCVNQFKRIIVNFIKPNGIIGDTYRDSDHFQFSIGGLMQIAEMLYLQKIDLYNYPDGRLARMMEIHALIMNGVTPFGINRAQLHLKDWVLPCGWHLALRHFEGRKSWSLPQTRRTYKRVYWMYSFHWGLSDIA